MMRGRRLRAWIPAMVPATLLLMTLAAPTVGAISGFMTWNNGKAGLAWDKDAPTEPFTDFEDLAGGDAVRREQIYHQWTQVTNGEAARSTLPYLKILSDPLPREIFVNDTSPVRVQFMTKADADNGHPCVPMDFELWMENGPRIAGGIHPWAALGTTPRRGCDSRLEMESIHGLEVQRLPNGSRLELRLYVMGLYEWRQFDLDRGSISWRTEIIIPERTTKEAILRGMVEPVAPTEVPGPSSAGLAPVLALGAAGLRRKAKVPFVIVACLLAGCIGGAGPGPLSDPDASPGGKAEVEYVPSVGGDLDGGIVGDVKDDLGFPVAGVRVSILGGSQSDTTDPYGSFSFANLSVGAHELVFAKPGMSPHSETVETRSGETAVVHVTLHSLVPVDVNERPHRHEAMWRDDSRVVLLDQDQEARIEGVPVTSCKEGMSVVTVLTENTPAHAPPYTDPVYDFFHPHIARCEFDPFRIPHRDTSAPVTVLPGTRELEINVTWPAGNKVERVGIAVQNNLDGGYGYTKAYRPYYRYYAPRPSSETFHVPVSWETSDRGHQAYSTWSFALYVPTNTHETEQTFPSPFHVKITALRGKMPLEPAHPDLWKGNRTRVVLDYATPQTNGLSWRPALIPPDTKWVEALLEQNWDSARDYGLDYKTNVIDDPWTPWAPADPRGPKWTHFRHVLCVGEADEVYRPFSEWLFRLTPDASTTGTVNANLDTASAAGAPLALTHGALEFRLTVIAHRDALSSGGCQK